MIKFSIITVTLNNLSGLRKTYDSIQNQTDRNYEWIVIDGGSQDGSVDFLKTTNAHFISEKDDGIYDAMNKGIDRASGSYLIFMNAGDVFFEPTILEGITADFDFCYGDAMEDGYTKKARSFLDFKKHMITHHQAMIYRRDCIDDMRYDLSYKIASDFDFTARFLKKAKIITYLAKPVCIFETGGISQQQASLGRQEQYIIRKKLALVSQFENIGVFIQQRCALMMRWVFPSLYWRMKARGSSDNSAIG